MERLPRDSFLEKRKETEDDEDEDDDEEEEISTRSSTAGEQN